MTSILIDTSFYIDILSGEKYAVNILQQTQRLLVCPIVIGEVLYGLKTSSKEKDRVAQFEKFLQSSCVDVVPIGMKTAQYFAAVHYELKKIGQPIPVNDIWIAACAMEHAVPLATNDKHFNKIPNLLIK